MSSEHDESSERMQELSVKSDVEKTASSPPKKVAGGSGEHAKPRRRRRGKKRKQRKESCATSETQEESEAQPGTGRDSPPSWDSDESLDCDTSAYTDNKILIRPTIVPKAPENSTQFIIDDHNECRLYMSFETPNPYFSNVNHVDGEGCDVITEPIPIGEDAAYVDIDFEYDPPQDFDTSAYYDREFELSYRNNRFDELLRLSRTDLISGLRVLEEKLKELSDELVKENPSPLLEKLQMELLELQEKHFELKECNSNLKAQMSKNESGSVQDGSINDPQTNLEQSMVTDNSVEVGTQNSEKRDVLQDSNLISDEELHTDEVQTEALQTLHQECVPTTSVEGKLHPKDVSLEPGSGSEQTVLSGQVCCDELGSEEKMSHGIDDHEMNAVKCK